VLVEALACGTPVVTTRGADTWREIAAAGGVIADATLDSIAATVGNLLAKPKELNELGARGRTWVFDSFAPGPLTQRYEMLYRGLIERPRSSDHFRLQQPYD
jgi:glycosyltransferase involved in cell wall biosynthesis